MLHPCTYHNHPALELAGPHLKLRFLAQGGPRILGLEFPAHAPGKNLLAETPAVHWPSAYGEFFLLGGRRLWHAPENADCAFAPDLDAGLQIEELDELTVRLTGAPEPSGLQKILEVRFHPDRPEMNLLDRTRNQGSQSLEVAQWAITQLPLGGDVSLPLPAPVPQHSVTPNRLFVLWPYTYLSDPRLEIGDQQITVHALLNSSGPDLFKIGYFNAAAWLSYTLPGLRMTLRFSDGAADLQAGHYPDQGCNVEIYCDRGNVELETLGPLQLLAPGAEISRSETWLLESI